MWLFKQYLNGPVETLIKARVTLPTKTVMSKEGCFISFSAIVNYMLNLFATDDNIATVNVGIKNLQQGNFTATVYAQNQWTKTLRCSSDYNEKIWRDVWSRACTVPFVAHITNSDMRIIALQ